MATVSVRGVDDARAMLLALGGNLKKAGDTAQTRMAFQVRGGVQLQMVADLDQPTPYSINSVMYKGAGSTADSAPSVPGAADYMLDKFRAGSRVAAQHYLGVQIEGGVTAGPRRSEYMMQGLGWMPRGKIWVPDRNAPRDSYGNISGALISAMLTNLGANPYGRSRNTTSQFVLIGQPGAEEGVWRKVWNKEWAPFIWFVDPAQYRKRFDFYVRADREIESGFRAIYDEEIQRALDRL